MARRKSFLAKLVRRNSGVAAVEMAIVLPLLILIIAGVLDLGHALYLKQIITNASREGARYGAVYSVYPGTTQRIPPDLLTPSIQNWVLKSPSDGGQCGLSNILGSDPTVALGGTGLSTGDPETGQTLSVTVSYDMNWWILDKFGLPNPLDLTATTTMRLE
jgi:hypothetical protein